MIQEIGKLFQEGTTKYEEGVKFDFSQSGATLFLFFRDLATLEIQSCKSGEFKIGFVEKDGIIFMLFKFENMQWIDAPYSVHLSPKFEFEEIAEGAGYSLQIYLVDADTGILKMIRLIGLGTEFSKRLKHVILGQKQLPLDGVEYDRKLQKVYEQYSTKDLVELALYNDFYKI